MSERFWLEDPSVLVSNLRFLPGDDLSFEENLNAITRLTILVAGVLAIAKWQHWLVFLLISIVLIIFAYLLKLDKSDKSSIEHFNENMSDLTFYKNEKAVQSHEVSSDLGDVSLESLYTSILTPIADVEPVKDLEIEGELMGVTFIPDKGDKTKSFTQHMRDFYNGEDKYDPEDRDRKALFHALF